VEWRKLWENVILLADDLLLYASAIQNLLAFSYIFLGVFPNLCLYVWIGFKRFSLGTEKLFSLLDIHINSHG
jgi:hypothetical protein